MRKLLRGIAEFRRRRRPEYAETFARLALEQKPDALFVACSDSRVVPNLFASTEPGDLFVVRNVGNLIPPADADGRSRSGESEAAAVELAVGTLGVRDIIVCGHSECGAMRAAESGMVPSGAPNLEAWLRHVRPALQRLRSSDMPIEFEGAMPPHDRLSQLNALIQLEHLRTYPVVQAAMAAGRLQLHAWWFDIGRADVLAWDGAVRRFVVLDEARVERLLAQMGE